jgi:hypothetical protein
METLSSIEYSVESKRMLPLNLNLKWNSSHMMEDLQTCGDWVLLCTTSLQDNNHQSDSKIKMMIFGNSYK